MAPPGRPRRRGRARGSGRLTVPLARRAAIVVAVEPAAPLRQQARGAAARGVSSTTCEIVGGFFDDLHLPSDSAGLVVACSAFTVEPGHGGQAGLDQMERVCRPGGLVVVI